MPRIRRSTPQANAGQTPPDPQVENEFLRDALIEARSRHEELRALLDQLSAPPWHPGLVQRVLPNAGGLRVLVQTGNASRVVEVHPQVDAEQIAVGDSVFLGPEQSLVVGHAPDALPRIGETATFERFTGDGRIVVRSRDEERVLETSGRIDTSALSEGDPVRFDRSCGLVLECLEPTAGRRYLLERAPDLDRQQIGGQDAAVDELCSALTASLVRPDLAEMYRIDGRRAVLLHGPPGCGKTLLARIAVAEVQRVAGRPCGFAVVRPGEFTTPYVGETEANIRYCFKTLIAEAKGGLAVIYLDEIEGIGRIRGARGAHHDDRFLAALLAEIDGFADRGQLALVCSTNRPDLLDPALLERLADVQIRVGRPDQRAAAEIFRVHLPESLHWAAEGAPAADVRGEAIEAAVSRLYAPNADAECCTLHFRDRTQRTVAARELVSGRLIEHIARAARDRAFRRHLADGHAGIRARDLAEAVDGTITRLSTTLTRHNAHAWLDDLPQDLDVVSVDPARRTPERAIRYVHAA